MPKTTEIVFVAAVLIALGLAAAPTAHGAVTLLSSSFAPVSLGNGGNEPTADGVFNLTALGTTDWINYGSYSATPNRKVGTQGTSSLVGDISVAALVGTGRLDTQSYQATPDATWTDGSAADGGSAATTGAGVSGGSQNNWQVLPNSDAFQKTGFTWTVTLPAHSTDTIKVFMGGYNVPSSALQVFALGTTADLLDVTSFTADGNGAGYFTQKFANTGAAPKTLKYALLMTSSGGNLKLADVTLASKPTS